VVCRSLVALGIGGRHPAAQLTLIAAIDNRDAATAVQNLNVMLGLPETAGLAC
jgi:N-acetyl-gamma-glutamylphosphate reductase